MLADVQPREVKAEHLDLADHVVQVTGRDPVSALRMQRALGQTQVGQQLGGVGVALAAPSPVARRRSRDEREEPPVRLFGVAPGQFGRQLWEALGAGLQRRLEQRRRTRHDARHGHALGEPLDAPLKEVQRHSPHEPERLARHRRCDVGVAVAVAADPGAERQQRRDDDAGTGIGGLDGVLELSVQARYDVEQRRVEVDEPGAHLVEGGRRDRANLVRAPQLLDGARQLRPRACASSSASTSRSSSSRITANTRASLATVVRRRASVGWAVTTKRISACASSSCRLSALVPRAAMIPIASRSDPRRGAGSSLRSRVRIRRTRSLSSARFTRRK